MIRVTRAITKHGRYYATGEILVDPSGYERSLARLWGWETNVSPDPVAKPVKRQTKTELIALAESQGLDPDGLTKNELIALLEE